MSVVYLSESTCETDVAEMARQEASVASRLKAAKVVMELQETGRHWTFTAKPKKD